MVGSRVVPVNYWRKGFFYTKKSTLAVRDEHGPALMFAGVVTAVY